MKLNAGLMITVRQFRRFLCVGGMRSGKIRDQPYT